MRASTLKTAREALTIGVIPDRVFSLAFEDRTRLNFALELDRGTMDIKSRQLVGKSSFRRKLLGYYQLWREGLHTSQWGFKAFRVLTVTPSEKRIENMIAVQREIVGEQGSNLFLFTTPKRLAEKSPLADVWVTGKGARDGSPVMTALACTDGAASFLWAPHLDGRILARAQRRQGRASRFTALPLAARPLTAPLHARATVTAMQMRSSARLTKYSETVRFE